VATDQVNRGRADADAECLAVMLEVNRFNLCCDGHASYHHQMDTGQFGYGRVCRARADLDPSRRRMP
jgi:hypothetical protein